MKDLNKKLIKSSKWMTLAGLAMFASAAMADTLDEKRLSSIKRDIRIMTNIVKTSVADSVGRSSKVQGLYLDDQGMMFTLSQGHSYWNFGHLLQPAPVAPAAPNAPASPSAPSASGSFDPSAYEAIGEYAIEMAESAMDLAEDQLERLSEIDWSNISHNERVVARTEQNELRNQRRELEREARGLEREVRDIERKIRDAEFQQEIEEDKKNQANIKRWEEELKQLTESLSGVADKIQLKAVDLQKKSLEMQKKRQEKQLVELKKMEMAISQSVCDFGAGLRSLPKGEHITFNIAGRNNQLYVFKQKDIEKCADGDLSAAKLLDKATKYSL